MASLHKLFLRLLPALALLLLGAAPAQETDRYFPETGHTVRGPFLAFFDSRGGLGIFGYPITDDYIDPRTGMLVQYFQRARMEWHPQNPEPYKVQLGLLADQMGKRRPALSPSAIPNTPDCHYFPETGQAVCYAFLDFFRQNGGVDVFGYPVSGFDVENGFTVQYFQRALMEWHPEKPSGQRVQLANLGSQYFSLNELNPDLLSPRGPISAGLGEGTSVTELQLRSSVSVPVAQLDGSQTAFLVVKDQHNRPVTGATGTLTVRYASGDRVFNLPPTDSSGTSRVDFMIDGGKPGQYVLIDYWVSYGDLSRVTSASFLLWW